jgi:hypothetical protein
VERLRNCDDLNFEDNIPFEMSIWFPTWNAHLECLVVGSAIGLREFSNRFKGVQQ